MSIEEELITIAKIYGDTSTSRQDFLAALARAVASLSDEEWGKLSDAAQEWFNGAAIAINEQHDIEEPDVPTRVSSGDATESGDEVGVLLEEEELPVHGSLTGYRKKVKYGPGRPKDGKVIIHSADRIRLNVVGNPKRPGSAAAKKWELYEEGMSVKDYEAKGGTRTTIRWDIRRGLISLDKRYRFRIKSAKKVTGH